MPVDYPWYLHWARDYETPPEDMWDYGEEEEEEDEFGAAVRAMLPIIRRTNDE